MIILKSPWLYVVLAFTFVGIFFPYQYREIVDNITSFLARPFFIEFAYILVRNKKIKEDFSIRRVSAFLFFLIVLEGTIKKIMITT